MFVLIAGGGLTASELARSLLAQGHQVHVVDWRRDVLARLHRELPTEAVFEGSLECGGSRSAKKTIRVT